MSVPVLVPVARPAAAVDDSLVDIPQPPVAHDPRVDAPEPFMDDVDLGDSDDDMLQNDVLVDHLSDDDSIGDQTVLPDGDIIDVTDNFRDFSDVDSPDADGSGSDVENGHVSGDESGAGVETEEFESALDSSATYESAVEEWPDVENDELESSFDASSDSPPPPRPSPPFVRRTTRTIVPPDVLRYDRLGSPSYRPK